MSNHKKELNKVECPTTVLNPNQRKQQKYSTWRGDHWPISVHFPLPFLYGYACFRGPYSNNSLIDQLEEERNPSWIALPCLKRFLKNRPWNSCFEEAMNIVFLLEPKPSGNLYLFRNISPYLAYFTRPEKLSICFICYSLPPVTSWFIAALELELANNPIGRYLARLLFADRTGW